MLTLLLYYISIWFYVVFVCVSVIVIVTAKILKLMANVITGNKI